MFPDQATEDLLRQALVSYAADPIQGDFILQVACAQAADPLPLYRTLYKFYNRQRRFDLAMDFAQRALAEAVRQANLPADYSAWTRDRLAEADPLVASQALLALKAQAFITLRGGDETGASGFLEKLRELDPEDGSGVSVVLALAAAV